MAISTGQEGGTSATFLCSIPPGPCDVVLTAASGTAYVGPSATIASGSGLVISGAAPTTFSTYPGSKGAQLYVAGTVSYLISTDS